LIALPEIRNVTVIGAGTMGHGISQVAAGAGYQVVIHDVSRPILDKALESIRSNLRKGVERGKVTSDEMEETLSRIRTDADISTAIRGANLVIEAVPESLDLKKKIFREVDSLAPDEVVFATNTSSLPVNEIASATRRGDKVVGMHFFNPVHIMPLLEIVRSPETSDETLRLAVEAGRRMGKECIVVKDSPGFATSRLGVILGLEAMRMLEAGVASTEDIDKAMTMGYRHPIGPLRLSDLVGLDTRLSIAEHLHRTLGSEAFRPPEILRRLVAEGKLGKKTGSGFYDWSQE
jgi:3-hydroxybutyryl-CoA dehydrogenase